MKCKVIGVTRKKGNYQGSDYDNCNMFVTFEADGMLGGVACKTYKMKVSKLPEIFEGCKTQKKIITADDVCQLIGKRIKVYPDDWGNPEEVFLLNE